MSVARAAREAYQTGLSSRPPRPHAPVSVDIPATYPLTILADLEALFGARTSVTYYTRSDGARRMRVELRGLR